MLIYRCSKIFAISKIYPNAFLISPQANRQPAQAPHSNIKHFHLFLPVPSHSQLLCLLQPPNWEHLSSIHSGPKPWKLAMTSPFYNPHPKCQEIFLTSLKYCHLDWPPLNTSAALLSNTISPQFNSVVPNKCPHFSLLPTNSFQTI